MAELRCGLQELQAFFRSRVWKDLELLLEEGLEDGHEELDAVGEQALSQRNADVCRGRILQVKMFQQFPFTVVERKRQELEDFEEESEESEEEPEENENAE